MNNSSLKTIDNSENQPGKRSDINHFLRQKIYKMPTFCQSHDLQNQKSA